MITTEDHYASASRIAMLAADLIARHGHAKHAARDDEGRYCAVGAVCQAATNIYGHVATAGIVLRAADELLAADGFTDGIIRYNNLPETTGEDVILLLKRVPGTLEIT